MRKTYDYSGKNRSTRYEIMTIVGNGREISGENLKELGRSTSKIQTHQ